MTSMVTPCLVLLVYYFYCTNGANMAAIAATVTAIAKMVIGYMGDVLLNSILGQPTLNSMQHLSKQLVSYFATTKWGGKHGFLPLVLSEAKISLTVGDNNLNCKRLSKPDLLNPKIEDDTKWRKLLQFQE